MNPVPREVEEFMNKEGAVLTVRGYPGTGKTTFALTLMNLRRFAYIGSRKNINDIKKTHPWISDNMLNLMFSIDEKYDYRETDRFGATFYLMPEAMRHAINLFEDGEIEGIIIDSWHTVLEELKIKAMEEKEREEVYNSQTFFLKVLRLSDYGIKFLIAKEGVEDDDVTYLSDGLVTMQRKFEEGRTFRWLVIDKMKGIEIKKNTYLFTLKDAKFQYMESKPFEHPDLSKLKGFSGKKIVETENIPSVYFDDVFMFERGSAAVYDFGEYIPKPYKLISIMGLIANFLKNGSRVVLIPPNELDVEEFKYQVLILGIESYFKNLVFLYPTKDFDSYVREVNFDNPKEISEMVKDEILNEEDNNPPLVVVGYNRLYSYLQRDDIMKLLYAIKDIVRKKGGVMIIAGAFWDKEIKRFCSNISEVYVKFMNISGNMLMYSIKPWSCVYHLSVGIDNAPTIVKREIV